MIKEAKIKGTQIKAKRIKGTKNNELA